MEGAQLDVHVADEAELLAAHANVHEAWGGDVPVEEHVARRLASPHHRRAVSWVGTIGGEVVTSLGLRPVDFDLGDGVVRPGFGLASVHTVRAHRRRGYAAALCRAAMEHALSAGRGIGLLFSEIEPRYYERLGFTALPARIHEARDLAALASGPVLALAPLDPDRELDPIARLHAASLAGTPHVVRDETAWRALLSIRRGAELRLLLDERGEACGYARTQEVPWRAGEPEGLDVQELCVLPGADEDAAWRALAADAVARGIGALHAWFAPSEGVAPSFTSRPRQGVPMVYDPDGTGAVERLSGARLFRGDSF